MTKGEVQLVRADARNRAFRTLLQGLVFDVSAAAILVFYTAFSRAETWSDLEWTLIGFTVTKSVMVSGLSYLMRTVFATKLMPKEG